MCTSWFEKNIDLRRNHLGPLHLRHVTVQPPGQQLFKTKSFQLLLNTVVHTLGEDVLKTAKRKRSEFVSWFRFSEKFLKLGS